MNPNKEQYELPLYYYKDAPVQAIIGLGSGDLSTDQYAETYNIIQRAYEDGLLKNNTYSFQGLAGDQFDASITIGGYSERLFKSDVEWYNLTTPANGDTVSNWRLSFTSFTFNTQDLMEAPPAEDPEENGP